MMIRRFSVPNATRKLRRYRRLNAILYIDMRTLNYFSDSPHKVRRATYAGSWYMATPSVLRNYIATSLAEANVGSTPGALVRAVIAPHAGYEYSLPVAAKAYAHLIGQKYTRIILMGPAHRAAISGCGVSRCATYKTPLGDFPVDTEAVEKLLRSPGFRRLTLRQDEEEHSLEMQLPLLRYVMGESKVKLVPIVVGEVSKRQEEGYGKALEEYMRDTETLFVVSSDFCHWGIDFDYMYYRKEDGQIHECIEKLDKRAMSMIEQNNIPGFYAYLEETENTICGRHPITILMHTIATAGEKLRTRFVEYKQSTSVKHPSESSVSYAAAVVSRVDA